MTSALSAQYRQTRFLPPRRRPSVGVEIRASADVLVVVHHRHGSGLLFAGFGLGSCGRRRVARRRSSSASSSANSSPSSGARCCAARPARGRRGRAASRATLPSRPPAASSSLPSFDLLRVDLERVEVDLVVGLHGHELDDRVLQLQVALDLGHEAAAAHVLQVDVDALALLADRVRQLAPAPRLRPSRACRARARERRRRGPGRARRRRRRRRSAGCRWSRILWRARARLRGRARACRSR